MIAFKSNIKQFVKKEISVMTGNVTKAHVRTVNEVTRGAFTSARKEIRSRINIKDKDLKKGSRVKKATYSKPTATIISKSSYRGLSLAKYGARQKKAGVSFMVAKGKRKTLNSAFIATMSSGHKGVFLRKTKSRLPIEDKYGPNPSQLLGSRKALTAVDRYVYKNYGKAYKRNFKYYQGRN